MDTIFTLIRGHAHGEWATVTGAPMLFSMAVLLTCVLLFFGLKAYFKERMDTLQATINHKQSMLDEYKERLHGATPVEVAAQIVTLKSEIDYLKGKVDRPQRRLTDTQRSTIIAQIKENAELVGMWFVLSSTPDTESSRFAVLLDDALTEAGITCAMNNLGRHDEGESGIIFYCSENGTNDNFLKIADIFEGVGLSITRGTDRRAKDQTYLFVAPDEA